MWIARVFQHSLCVLRSCMFWVAKLATAVGILRSHAFNFIYKTETNCYCSSSSVPSGDFCKTFHEKGSSCLDVSLHTGQGFITVDFNSLQFNRRQRGRWSARHFHTSKGFIRDAHTSFHPLAQFINTSRAKVIVWRKHPREMIKTDYRSITFSYQGKCFLFFVSEQTRCVVYQIAFSLYSHNTVYY